MKKYIILFFAVFFISCQGGKKTETIGYIKVWYYNGVFDRASAIDCNEIIYSPEKVDTLDILLEDGSYLPKEAVVLESIIIDQEILQEIRTELRKREVISEDYMDARMKCYIVFNNGQIDSLCIGNMPICANYNGQAVKLTNELVYLIRENCGFYNWIGIDQMQYFEELNDSTFVRDKVISVTGEMY
jgi:hypothetical protein